MEIYGSNAPRCILSASDNAREDSVKASRTVSDEKWEITQLIKRGGGAQNNNRETTADYKNVV